MSAIASWNLTAWGVGGVGKWAPHPHLPTSVRDYFPKVTPAVNGRKLVDPPLSRMLTKRPSTKKWLWPMPTETPPPKPNANFVSLTMVPAASILTWYAPTPPRMYGRAISLGPML